MSTDEIHELASAYAVHALDAAEQEAFEAHLPTCPACQDLVSELQEASVHLSDGLELAPPSDLRARVLAQVGAEAGPVVERPQHVPGSRGADDVEDTPDAPDTQEVPAAGAGDVEEPVRLRGRGRRGGTGARRPGRRTWLAAAAAAVVIGGAAIWGTQVLGPDEVDRVVQAADAQEYTAEGEEGQMTVVTSVQEDAAALELPSAMPPPEAGTVYQAWFVLADESVRSAGVLGDEALDEDGTILVGSPEGAVAVGLSVEPEGGSEQPTTEPFAVVPLG